jgi:Glycosyl transferases group 1
LEAHHLHIVSFDVPFPADYGGVIDVFFKIKALSEIGIKVHLHCFQYGRKAAPELNAICETIHYYPRKKIYTGLVSRVPYIVGSRINPDLLERLSSDPYPILFEGLHTCAYLDHPLLKDKIKAVRMHNVEWQYYRGLFDHSTETLKSIYYAVESKRLQRYESVLVHANHIFAISKTETEYLESRYPQTSLIFPFHGVRSHSAEPGIGKYMLYHGNLSVPENEEAVEWLVANVKPESEFPLIIAGKKPGSKLKAMLTGHAGFQLIENPSSDRMDELIAKAHLHILPAFQSTGVKLKLVKSLFQGRFVLTNPQMVEGTGLDEVCISFRKPARLQELIRELRNKPFTQTEIDRRKNLLGGFNDHLSASAIREVLFSGTSTSLLTE